ncbi:MAG: ribbon-helix-helix protein, CopG family [Coriobacteriia bacterium]|nr:ribbon-helix-helix protein, CopG family [Coriobacteriia bacterium]
MAKVNVYVPDELLEVVDAGARADGKSRSSVVQEALAEYVTARNEAGRRTALERAITTAEAIAGRWSAADVLPDVGASEYLVGLRAADDGDPDARIVKQILSERGEPADG